MQVRRQWSEIFKVLREKKKTTHLEFSIPWNYLSKVKNFPDKQNMREFAVNTAALQEMLEILADRK